MKDPTWAQTINRLRELTDVPPIVEVDRWAFDAYVKGLTSQRQDPNLKYLGIEHAIFRGRIITPKGTAW